MQTTTTDNFVFMKEFIYIGYYLAQTTEFLVKAYIAIHKFNFHTRLKWNPMNEKYSTQHFVDQDL